MFELLRHANPPPSLIILGTGPSIAFPSPVFMKLLREIAPVEVLGMQLSYLDTQTRNPRFC